MPVDRERFTSEDLNSLMEMHPPSFMPNGNVGTKTSQFLEEIRACRLPPQVIMKLGLKFPRNRARHIYGSVPFNYDAKQNKHLKFNLGYQSIHRQDTWFQKTNSVPSSHGDEIEVSYLILFNSNINIHVSKYMQMNFIIIYFNK